MVEEAGDVEVVAVVGWRQIHDAPADEWDQDAVFTKGVEKDTSVLKTGCVGCLFIHTRLADNGSIILMCQLADILWSLIYARNG